MSTTQDAETHVVQNLSLDRQKFPAGNQSAGLSHLKLDGRSAASPSSPLGDFMSTFSALGNGNGIGSPSKSSFWRRGASKLPGIVKPVPTATGSGRLVGANFPHGANLASPALASAGNQNRTSPTFPVGPSASPSGEPKKYDDFIAATNDDWTGEVSSDSEEKVDNSKSPRTSMETDGEKSGASRSPGLEQERQSEKDVLALNKRMARTEKFKNVINSTNVDLATLRKLSWGGIPDELRPMTWQLLLGYLPSNADRRLQTLARKRKEYEDSVAQNYQRGQAGLDQALWHQIHIDVPRTNPGVPLYQCQTTQECLERVLYCWAIRHPASGYVQGINDLCTPFFQVFLSSYIEQDPETFDTSRLEKQILTTIEADTFWCLTKLLDSIQDNYTFAQPGIQRQVAKLKDLVARIDTPLSLHFQSQEVEFIQFAFRWMNCLLMREMSLKLTVRMWDTYLAEGADGFAGFHLYVCAAFLVKWSEQLRKLDFQGIMMFLQSIPTAGWDEKDIELLLSEAYMWQTLFQNAQSHLTAA